jgi:Nickel responsive protein SCO4226-like
MSPPCRDRTVARVTRRSEPRARQAYLVEHYRPDLEPEQLGRLAKRVRASAAELEREGRPVRYLRSTIVPRDESLLLVIEAASEQLVREVYLHAGFSFERLSPAVTEEGS